MRRKDIDWKILRGAISIFMVSIVISTSIIAGSVYFKSEMLFKFNKDNKQFKAISSRYLAVDEEKQLIKEFYPEFLELYKKGFLGREHRLNWIEVLRISGDRIKLPSLSYDIASQNQYVPDYSINTGGFQIFKSTMVLTMDLLHEGDLFRLLEDLDNKALGAYNVSECEFVRVSKELHDNAEQGNILTKCILNWFNIQKSDGSEIDFT